jgi:predicted transcriptional regulator
MNWQDFLNQQADTQGLSVEEKNTLSTTLPHADAQINQIKLSNELQITEATVKNRLQKIYKKFENVCPELAENKGAGKFEKLRIYLKHKYHQLDNKSNPVTSEEPILTKEFQSLITEKINSFCGRKFVFTAFENFINTNKKGYFTVIGDAGMGKSTIAAKYVSEHKTICYFNNLQENRNSPELFLESIRQQLINRYQLTNVDKDDLSTLLVKATEKPTANEKLIIIVDALDEVKQEPGGENILYLPKTLPDNVYFFLTRRRYEPTKERLYTEGLKKESLDLTDSKYDQENQHDIQEYIRFCLNNDPEHKDGLQTWIETKHITPDAFVNQLATKSENNFMYLRYVLPAIAEGKYNDLNLTQLPQGLQNYYQTHWERMNMNDSSKKMRVMILFILVEIGTPISDEMIFEILNEDECDVQDILNEWIEYLKPQTIDKDMCYSIYHASFLDFLKAKKEFKPTRQLFEEVNKRIADYLEQDDEDENETN